MTTCWQSCGSLVQTAAVLGHLVTNGGTGIRSCCFPTEPSQNTADTLPPRNASWRLQKTLNFQPLSFQTMTEHQRLESPLATLSSRYISMVAGLHSFALSQHTLEDQDTPPPVTHTASALPQSLTMVPPTLGHSCPAVMQEYLGSQPTYATSPQRIPSLSP